MKKKIITLVAICALLLTGCSNNANSSEATVSSENTTTAESTTAESTTSAEETTPAVDTSAEDVPSEAPSDDSSSAKALADVVMNAIEWPAMAEQTDAFMVSDYFGLDILLTEDYCIQQNMMSVHLNEIIIVKPLDGNMDAVMDALNAHLTKLQTELAFYPAQLESANAALVNNHGGYAYLICHEQAVTAEEALTAAIDAL